MKKDCTTYIYGFKKGFKISNSKQNYNIDSVYSIFKKYLIGNIVFVEGYDKIPKKII